METKEPVRIDRQPMPRQWIQPESVIVNLRLWDGEEGQPSNNGRVIAKVEIYGDGKQFFRYLHDNSDSSRDKVQQPFNSRTLRLLANFTDQLTQKVIETGIIQDYNPWPDEEEEE